MSGVAVNNVLPGRIGDLLRARWLQVAARIPGGRALATVFVDRAFDVFALVAFLAISLVFVSSAEWLLRMAVGGLILFGAIALILIVSRAYTRRRARDRRAERSFLRRIARDLIEGLAEPLGMSRTLTLAGLSLATWAMWGLAASFVARAVGIELSVVEAIFLTAVINLGVAIPLRRASSAPTNGSVSPPSRTSTSRPSRRSPSQFSCTRSGTSPPRSSAGRCSSVAGSSGR